MPVLKNNGPRMDHWGIPEEDTQHGNKNGSLGHTGRGYKSFRT